MDAKVTLSFDANVIEKAKEYARSQGLSLSRLMEIMLRKVTAGGYAEIEDIAISDWVSMVSEGEVEYKAPKPRKKLKEEFFNKQK